MTAAVVIDGILYRKAVSGRDTAQLLQEVGRRRLTEYMAEFIAEKKMARGDG